MGASLENYNWFDVKKYLVSNFIFSEQEKEGIHGNGMSIISVDDFENQIPESIGNQANLVLFLLDKNSKEERLNAVVSWLREVEPIYSLFLFDGEQEGRDDFFKKVPADNIYFIYGIGKSLDIFLRSIDNAFNFLFVRLENLKISTVLVHRKDELDKLTAIGKTLSTERDQDKLLQMILTKGREITNSDVGSIYLVDRKDPTKLHFKFSALDLDKVQFTLPVDKSSLAGYVALTGKILNIPDAYHIDDNADYHFNSSYDEESNYYTKSMIVLPMKNHNGKVVGVLQLINRKRDYNKPFNINKLDDILPFDLPTQELAMAAAGQATVAIENNLLLKDIEELFEGFIKASVSAIESRDPTTSGHSARVAELTESIAIHSNRNDSTFFKDICLNQEQLNEIKYAALLHDFGKIGVKEEVLVKAKKLYPSKLEIISWRFEYIKKNIELHYFKRREKYLLKYGKNGYEKFLVEEEKAKVRNLTKVDDFYVAIASANEPHILAEDDSEFITNLNKKKFYGPGKVLMPVIEEQEIEYLRIPKGTLTPDERKEIESHVTHTYNFLKQIPWTSNLAGIPDIAYGHHEKLDGTGYPRNLKSAEIPVQSKMMTIADIYDALTASDRPYKKAVPVHIALRILESEAKEGKVEQALFDLFIEAKIYEVVGHKLEY